MNKSNYIKMIFLSGLFALMGLSSCQVTNKYKSPEVESENLFRDRNNTDTTTIAKITWREYFSDPYLQSYIQQALEHNYDMQIAQELIVQAEAMLGMARAAYFPEVALTAQASQKRLSSADPLTGTPKSKNTLGYHTESYSLGLVASWEIDIWGKMNRQSKAKYAQMLNSYAGKSLIQTSLISNIANTYYALLGLDEKLKVTNDMVVLMEESLITMEALKEGGVTNGAAVEQTRASLARVKTTIPDLETNIRQLENALCAMMGKPSEKLARTSISTQQVPTTLAFGVPAQMLALRPDVNQAELEFRSAFELTYAAKADFYPSITLTSGSIGLATVNSLSNFFKPANLFANIAGGLTQPIFARKQIKTQYELAKSEQKIALLNFEKAVLSAGQEVSDILDVYESSFRKNADREVEVNALVKAVDFTQELLKANDATYLEVLTAQQGLLEAQLSQVSDKLQQLQATSSLYRALGGGIE